MEVFNSEELLKLFTQYAMKEGSSDLLSISGLQSLVRNHFPNLLGSLSLNDIAKYADVDKDGKVNFDDVKALLTKLSSMAGLSSVTGLSGLVS